MSVRSRLFWFKEKQTESSQEHGDAHDANKQRDNDDSLVKIQGGPDHGADQADQDEHGQR